MKLSVMERVLILQMLGGFTNNIVTLKLVQKCTADMGFTEDEIKALSLRSEGQKIFWENKSETEEKEIDIPDIVKSLISGKIKEMDEHKSLTKDFITLYDKFFPESNEKKD